MRERIARSAGYVGALMLAGAAVFAAPAAAQASAVVPCSSDALVTAINQANSARFAVLLLSRGCTYGLATRVAGNDGLPPVTGNLLILGSGGTTIRRTSGTPAAFRIFDVAAGGRLTLVNVTVANGDVEMVNGAGGILDGGTLVLRNVRLTGNTSAFGGGLAVESGAHARISHSELDGNDSLQGGAIFSSGDLVIDDSRLTGNTAIQGGAVFPGPESTTRISRTVVTHNRAVQAGGGILNEGAMVLTGDRIVSNTAGRGGGIFDAADGTTTLRFTLVAFNTPDNCSPQGTIGGCQN
jgi:hypothetical protein